MSGGVSTAILPMSPAMLASLKRQETRRLQAKPEAPTGFALLDEEPLSARVADMLERRGDASSIVATLRLGDPELDVLEDARWALRQIKHLDSRVRCASCSGPAEYDSDVEEANAAVADLVAELDAAIAEANAQ